MQNKYSYIKRILWVKNLKTEAKSLTNYPSDIPSALQSAAWQFQDLFQLETLQLIFHLQYLPSRILPEKHISPHVILTTSETASISRCYRKACEDTMQWVYFTNNKDGSFSIGKSYNILQQLSKIWNRCHLQLCVQVYKGNSIL